MNVNFFICENLLLLFFSILFCLGAFFFSFFFFFFFFSTFGERATAAAECQEPHEWLGGRALPCRALALSPILCVSCLLSFKIGILHVEPAIEDRTKSLQKNFF